MEIKLEKTGSNIVEMTLVKFPWELLSVISTRVAVRVGIRRVHLEFITIMFLYVSIFLKKKIHNDLTLGKDGEKNKKLNGTS